ncbi:glutathione S-transferase family protein [Pseudoruegeria sp. SHC-113]|uniref:glutathione S-transferase family protein n=1 Tax=Pseudoruegeria sp. SHC-113 TaxID=2855439 RepID=UPI0021BB767E|nr:glutathione S-transferase family protein [Pseudoruegeria sp. SHC-113]MCT8161982.1 glutathione S-transferase family protein [Pseudoruegeria sp. SHC-113]
MQLYYAPGTVAVASAIAMEEAGIAYEPVLVDFTTGAQMKPAYHAVNPKGRVPTLATDQGLLTETGAILEYIAALAPEAGLMPTDPWHAAQTRALMHYLGNTMHVAHAHKMRGHRWADQDSSFADMTAKVPQTMAECCAYLEGHVLTGGPFALGESFTLADTWLYTICRWLAGDSVDITAYPKLARHFETIAARPSVARIRERGIIT